MSLASPLCFWIFISAFAWSSLRAEAPPSPEAQVFTNHASIQLYATPESLNESTGVLRFRRLDGSAISVPLSAFPKTEQVRILTALGRPPIPDDLKVPFERYRARLEKARALHQKGLMSDEDLKETEDRLAKAWALRLSKRPPDAPPMPQQINITEER